MGRGFLGAYRIALPGICTNPIRTKAIIQFHPSRGGNQQSAQNDQGKKSRQNIASLKVVPNRRETPSEFHKSSFDLRLLDCSIFLVSWPTNKVQRRCPPVSGSASRCSHGNELDLLVVGRCVRKSRYTNTVLKQDYSSAFELD